jgi:hypothetical protein
MRRSSLLMLGLLGLGAGCVSVHTPNVDVDVSDPVTKWHKDSNSDSGKPARASDVRYTPYAKTLERTMRQQSKVEDQFAKRDWKDVEEKANDWITDIRKLSEYAPTSHNPERYRSYSAKLLEAAQEVRRSAVNRDAEKCRKALDDANRIMDEFTKYFPTTEPINAPPPEKVSGPDRVP